MNEAIYNWLHGDKNYESGVLLYLQHGNNPSLKFRFQRPKNSFIVSKLEYELKKLIGNWQPSANEVQLSKPIVINDDTKIEFIQTDKGNESISIPSKLLNYSHYPTELQNAITERQLCYRTRDRLFAQLGLLPSKKQRYLAQKEMLRCQRRLTEIWHALDYFDTHKVILPEFQQKPDLSAFNVLNGRKLSLRTYISKYKKRTDDKGKAKLKEYEQEYNDILKQLGEL